MPPPPSLPRAERKAKKRKLEASIPSLPSTTEPPLDDLPAPTKRQKTGAVKGTNEEKTEGAPAGHEGAGELVRKSKKERKAERKAREAAGGGQSENSRVESKGKGEEGREGGDGGDGDDDGGGGGGGDGEVKDKAVGEKSEKKKRQRGKKKKSPEGEESSKAPRFIVFIGNLPFTATTASITSHFSTVHPQSVRHLTQKDDPRKSKGCAFVEFEGYDHMKTCLKLFHHSMFDDGVSAPRRINVELTAGGGGNTKDRRTKIQDKNTKLNEERVRRLQEEEKAKWEKAGQPVDESGIHPSRRARVDGA
ncbi:hypothetical protein BJ875DRAFT_500883 [Amylocarpus encephaloides]|uniref:RRM domain-containing protein n=1 Tax=Amylocarpus encephaloides TaxID=45428 RepID=A0A9P7Y6V1_9HELO|nr:hypothetical protein BJ875DRAFT_500883 [Amylocarpus encephaloides]